jgi:hypothetical protein
VVAHLFHPFDNLAVKCLRNGDLPDNDEACSIAGAQSAGFETEVGETALGKQQNFEPQERTGNMA